MKTIIESKKLTKIYHNKSLKTIALDSVNLTVNKGEFIGIMGPSGAGKTTLLNLLASIDQPTSGQVIFQGEDINSLNSKELARFRRDHIGFLFQDFNLLHNMTIKDNIALPLSLQDVSAKEIVKRVEGLSHFLGIKDHLEKYPYQLSGGQKQRAAAARAMISNPSVILADEPTGALDSKSATIFLKYLEKLNRELGATILMVTHDPYTASFCKQIVFIKDGRIHTKLNKGNHRQEFYNRILDLLASMGGAIHEVDETLL